MPEATIIPLVLKVISSSLILSALINWDSSIKRSTSLTGFIVHFFTSLWTRGGYFILCVITQSIRLTFCFNLPVSATGSSFSLASGPWVFLMFFVVTLSHLLTLQDAPGLPCIFPTPALELGISPRSPGSLYWRTAFRKQDLAPSVLLDTEVSVLLGSR